MNNPLTIGLDELSRLAKEAGAEADAQARAAGITPAAKSVFGEAGKGRKGAPRAGWIVTKAAEGALARVAKVAFAKVAPAKGIAPLSSEDDDRDGRQAPDQRSGG